MRAPSGLGVQAVHAGRRARPGVRAHGTVLERPFDDHDPGPRCAATDGELWQPTNAGDSSAGTVDLKGATQNSVNTVFAQLVTALDNGPDDVVRMAHRLGIESELPAVCSITLGSVQINPLEMTNAYSTLASEGTYHRANPLFEVTRSNGQPARRVASPAKEAKVDPNVANQVTSALQAVIEGGTGSAASIDPWPAAGKTGSAQDNVDAWFCGYTVQLTTCVWVGYPEEQRPLINIAGVPTVYGGTIPAAIWREFMFGAMAYGRTL